MPQRFRAALIAISRRRSGVSASALAGPPFLPPLRPNATAARFSWASVQQLSAGPAGDWGAPLPLPRALRGRRERQNRRVLSYLSV